MGPAGAMGLVFRVDPGNGQLSVRFDPGEGAATPAAPVIRQAIADHGYAGCWLDDVALARFAEQCASATQPVEAVVGECRDGSFQLELSDDRMTVWLTLVPPQGGKPAGGEVHTALAAQGIAHGLDEAALEVALARGECRRERIAQGEPPHEGVPTRFESLLPHARERRPQVDAHGVVDYRNLGQILIVHAGDVLMRRHPAQPGKAGQDVTGRVVPSAPLADLPWADGLTGVAPSPDDRDLLVASMTGQPVVVERGVIVDPVIEVDSVDLHSGNLRFEGTVRVRGDVTAGMKVEATGDVEVAGMVEAAEIVAGGDVVVRGGVVGNAASRGTVGVGTHTAHIECGGSVSARFMESAFVRAGRTILVEDSARDCDLAAREQLIAGGAGGKHGSLSGGQLSAGQLVKAAVLGALSGVRTVVLVGFDPQLVDQLAAHERTAQRLQGELLRVSQLATYYAQHPERDRDGVGEKAARTAAQLQEAALAQQQQKDQLLAQQQLLTQARVEVERALFGGVEIHLGSKVWRVVEDTGACKLVLHEGQIVRE